MLAEGYSAILLWTAGAFLSGSLPLSVWLGRWALQTDIRRFGDHNPGGANVWRAGGPTWGGLAILLDFLKGAVPVALANFVAGLPAWGVAAVALAPVVGHAFSPWLKFRGGKALAVTFGVWTGLSLWRVPLLLGALFAFWLLLLAREGWAVLLGMAGLLVLLLRVEAGSAWLAVCLGNGLVLAWKQRADLGELPRLRFQLRRPGGGDSGGPAAG